MSINWLHISEINFDMDLDTDLLLCVTVYDKVEDTNEITYLSRLWKDVVSFKTPNNEFIRENLIALVRITHFAIINQPE